MTIAPQPQAQKKALSTGAVIALAVGLLCAASIAIGVVMNARGGTSSPTAPAAAPDPFDRAAFDAYWAGPGVTAGTRDMVTTVDWTGGILTAHTKLVADSDAVAPATTICGALSGYWALQGAFQPVRVMDGADQILVSRHTLGDTCTWRR